MPARWLREEADAGRVPCLRAGSSYLFDVALLEAALLERAATPPTPRSSPTPTAPAAQEGRLAGTE